MSFPVLADGSIVSADLISDSGAFFISYADVKVEIETSLALDSSFEGKNFEIYPLISPGVLESNIHQIYNGHLNKRVGWLIPVISLESNQHSFADNEHFLKYAYIAIRDGIRCLGNDVFKKKCDVSAFQKLRLSDLFHESTVFLVLSKETLTGGCEFDINRALPSLISSGYIPLTLENPDVYGWNFSRKRRVSYLLASDDIVEHEVVVSLMLAFSLSRNDSLIRFFYLYQIIELLIERVAKHQLGAVVAKVVEAGDDLSRLKSALESVGRELSEKERLNKLVGPFCGTEINFDRLTVACRTVLDDAGKECKSGLPGALYPVRNLVFHSFRTISASSREALEVVVLEFLEVIPVLLANFREPEFAAA